MSVELALSWVQKLVSIAVLLQTIEVLLLKDVMSEKGTWKWSLIQKDFAIFPRTIARIFDWLLRPDHFELILWIRLALSVLFFFVFHPFVGLFLFFSTCLISWRWRGTFNGGSDFMTLIVLGVLVIAAFAVASPSIQTGCLLYLGLQTASSYFISGFTKIKHANWRQGFALTGFLNLAVYNLPKGLGWILKNRRGAKGLSWGVMIFECLFPLALTSPKYSLVFIVAAIGFHFANWACFGLNRFLWSWLPTYPALYYCSLWLQK